MAREPLKVLTESMFYVLLSLLRQERLCVADGEREELASERLLPGMREEAP